MGIYHLSNGSMLYLPAYKTVGHSKKKNKNDCLQKDTIENCAMWNVNEKLSPTTMQSCSQCLNLLGLFVCVTCRVRWYLYTLSLYLDRGTCYKYKIHKKRETNLRNNAKCQMNRSRHVKRYILKFKDELIIITYTIQYNIHLHSLLL